MEEGSFVSEDSDTDFPRFLVRNNSPRSRVPTLGDEEDETNAIPFSPIRGSKSPSVEVEKLSKLAFDELPLDMLKLLMSNLSIEDAARLCKTDKKLQAICKKHDLVNRKLREFLQEQTPLAKPVYSLGDQYDLVKRGCKTTYSFDERDESVVFGIRENSVLFEILGLPPPKGTKVLLLYYKRTEYNEEQQREGDVFLDLEDLYETVGDLQDQLPPGILDFFVDVYYDRNSRAVGAENDTEDPNLIRKLIAIEVKERLRAILEDDEDDESFGLKSVELP